MCDKSIEKNQSRTLAITSSTDQAKLERGQTDLWGAIRTLVKSWQKAPPIKPVSREKNLPLSFAQQRLWLLDQLQPSSSVYNIPKAVQISGYLDKDALKKTLDTIVARHESLHTIFVSIEGKPAQVIAKRPPVKMLIIDLSQRLDADREAEAQCLLKKEIQRPFNLSSDLMLRAMLLQLGDQEHILLLVMHHIASDGWSIGILFREFMTLYEVFASGGSPSLASLPIQYADFAVWQRQWLQGEVLEKQLAYWKQQLSGELPVLELPTDYSRPALQSFRGARQGVVLSKALTESLKELSYQEGVTLFMTLLAAFKTLLHRYTGQHDIIVGSPIAGRNQLDIKELIGFFVNTLVLRTDLSGDPSFRELLKRVREVSLDAYAYQELPFEKLVEELRPERDVSRNPLFQVMFALQNVPVQAPALSDLTLRSLEIDRGTTQFDLTLFMFESEEEINGTIVYSTDLFDFATINRMLGHLETLLESIVTNPDQRLSDLSLLKAAEQHQLLVEWNDTLTDYPKDLCIHQLFEIQVQQTPDAIAVIFEKEKLTYQDLNYRANQLAHYLVKCGVGPEVLVGICMERSVEMVIGLLGILKAGGAYVPLDPTYPPDRLDFMLNDAEMSVLLTQQRLLTALPEHQIQVVCLDNNWASIAQERKENPTSGVTKDNLAYVIYTSGSTGRPKGVMNTHYGINNRLLWMQDAYQLTAADRVLQKTPFSFDVSVWEFFWPLLVGARLVVAKPEGHKDSVYLAKLICEQRITTLHFVPPMLQIFLEAEDLEVCGSLKRVFCSGEALSFELQERFFSCLNAELHNLYGPTEAAVDVTFWDCRRKIHQGIVPIGRPIANTQIYILDRYLQPVPIGVPGELHISGVGLARGYLNQPVLTAEKFVPNPFSEGLDTRLYKTGDLARYLPDGNIEFLGRLDHQVKIRGFRIELGEIEAVLNQHSAVQETVILAQEVDSADKDLIAYLVLHEECSPTINDLRDFLKQKLPEYMTPRFFVFLDVLPLTPNGKVDRRALPVPSSDRPELEENFVEPQTPTEEVLAGIWAEVLAVDQIGSRDNFFDLGGHSLLATQLISRVRDLFQVELPLRSLFEAPTVAGLSEAIQAIHLTKHGLQVLPIESVARNNDLPLSFEQERLWTIDRVWQNSLAYNTPIFFRLKGRLDVTALQHSLNEIIQRHEILRTTFENQEGKLVQVIAPTLKVAVPVVDLREIPETKRESEASRLASEESKRAFDLAKGPSLRMNLLRLYEEEHVVLLTMHHIISDGWSIGVLMREIAALYAAFSTGKPSPLPKLFVQYADFAVWQRQRLQGKTLENQLLYWKQLLSDDFPVLELPTKLQRTNVPDFRGRKQSLFLDACLSKALKKLSHREGVTLFMTLLAAFKVLLHHYTGQSDIVLGSHTSGRDRPEIEGLIGLFINTIALRTDLSGNPSFRSLIVQVRKVCLEANAHQIPLKLIEELQQTLNPKRAELCPRPYRVSIDVANTSGKDKIKLPGLTVEPFSSSGNIWLQSDLSLRAQVGSERIHLDLLYQTSLFDDDTIARMLEKFQILLEGIVSNPENQISDLLSMVRQEQP